jgi:hypothetical protein
MTRPRRRREYMLNRVQKVLKKKRREEKIRKKERN